MRILLVTQYFYPETFKGNDIAFELTKRGHKVDVLCGIPNYPNGSYTMGYGIFKKRRETINGVNIYRTFQFPRGKSSKFMMILNYFSFSFWRGEALSHFILFFFLSPNNCSKEHSF